MRDDSFTVHTVELARLLSRVQRCSIEISPIVCTFNVEDSIIDRNEEKLSLCLLEANDKSSFHKGMKCLQLLLPTVDRASKWFSAKSSTFHHQPVGMTNPHFVICYQ